MTNVTVQTQSLWFSQHLAELEPYEGKWVAIANERLVGVGESVSAAVKDAEGKGITKPLIVKVPRKDEGPFALVIAL